MVRMHNNPPGNPQQLAQGHRLLSCVPLNSRTFYDEELNVSGIQREINQHLPNEKLFHSLHEVIFCFCHSPKNMEKISVRISYALWFLVELQKLPLGLLFAVFTIFFFFLLNYQVKIQLFLMALTLCVSHSHI